MTQSENGDLHRAEVESYKFKSETLLLTFDQVSPDRGWEFFSLPPCPDRLWGAPSLLSNGYQGLFPWDKAAGPWSWPLASI